MDPLDPNVDWETKSTSNKRKRPVNERRGGDQDEEHEHLQRKMRTTSSTSSHGPQVGGRTEDEEEDYEGVQYEGDEGELDPDEILRLVNQLDKVETLDISGLKRLILKVEKAITKNQQHRVKYASDPRKFMDSEVELHSELVSLGQLTVGTPELYKEFVKLGAVTSLLSLFEHENEQIVSDVVNFFHELFVSSGGEGAVGEGDEENALTPIVAALIENNGLELLVSTLITFDKSQEPDDFQAVHSILSILESVTEIDTTTCQHLVEKTDLMKWILQRIKSPPNYDQNKEYASEILAILLQNNTDNQRILGELDGLESLLVAVNPYKKKDPSGVEEEEMIENIFDCICSSLLYTPNKKIFLKAQGIELMLIMVKNKKFVRKSALKVIDFCLQRNSEACAIFVDRLGLKTLFAAFMKKGSTKKNSKKNKKGFSEKDDDEHLISTINSLFAFLKDYELERLLTKFSENEFEKIERLIELHEKYAKSVTTADRDIRDQILDAEETGETLDEDRFYLVRLDAGLFTLQLVDLVLASVYASNLTGAKPRILEQLRLNDIELDSVKGVIDEYAENLGIDSIEEKKRALDLSEALQAPSYTSITSSSSASSSSQ